VRLSFVSNFLSSFLCYFLSHKILRVDGQEVIGKIDELGRLHFFCTFVWIKKIANHMIPKKNCEELLMSENCEEIGLRPLLINRSNT